MTASQRQAQTGAGSSAWRRVLERVVAAEPLFLLAVAPLLWFPRPASAAALLLVPALWLVRWLTRGYPSVRTPYDVPAVGMLLLLPLALVHVMDWTLAAPKLYGVLLGIALVYALANSLQGRHQALFGVYATAVVLGGGIVTVGLIGTEWEARILPLETVYRRLPLLIQGVVEGTKYGGVNPNEIGGALTLLSPLALAGLLARLEGRPQTASPRGELVAPGVGAPQADEAVPRPRPRDGTQERRSPSAGGPSLARGRAIRWILPVILLTVWVSSTLVIGLTQSLSAYLGTAAGLLLLLGWALLGRSRTTLARSLAAAMGAVALLLAAGTAFKLTSAVATAPGATPYTLEHRRDIWVRNLYILQSYPVTGIGIGQFPLVQQTPYLPLQPPPESFVPHAHNFFLQLGLDLGVPGAVAVLFILGGFFRSTWAAWRRAPDPELRAMAFGLSASVLAYLVYGLTDTIAIGARGGIGLWIILGLGAAVARAAGGRP